MNLEEVMEVINTEPHKDVLFKDLEHLITSLLQWVESQEGAEMLSDCSDLHEFEIHRFINEFYQDRIESYENEYTSEIQRMKTDVSLYNQIREMLPFMNGK